MLALSLLAASPAFACDRIDVDAPGVSIHVSDEDCAPPVAVLVPAAPVVEAPAPVEAEDEDDGDDDHPADRQRMVVGQYGMQFLPESPAHQLSLRLIGEGDSYVGGELRYLPGEDFVGVGRVGAGFDVTGGGAFDLTLGLFVGAAGEWQRQADAAALWGSPVLGTEVGLGLEGRHLFVKYRWLGGIGTGPLDDLMTEQELVFGYKVTQSVHLMGQYFVLDPGNLDNRSGVGLGLRIAL